MGKRSSVQAAKLTNKKIKPDPALEPVASILREAEHLPPLCRAMLVDMLPLCLSFPANQRHELQSVVVEMVAETFDAKKSEMDKAVATEQEKLDSLKASEEKLMSTMKEAEVAIADQQNVVQQLTDSLANATTVANASAEVLAERRDAKKIGDENVATAKAEKVALEAAFQTHYKAPMEEGIAGPCFRELEPFLAKVELEPSLLTALPSSCAKSKEHRGNFDEVVLQELEKAISSKIEALGAAVEVDGPASVEREGAVQAAEKDCEAKNEARNECMRQLEDAQRELGVREEALCAAKSAVEDFQPQLATLTVQADTLRAELTEFEAGPLATFLSSKTRIDVPAEAVPAGA
jgi:chromosome segregation ATPase